MQSCVDGRAYDSVISFSEDLAHLLLPLLRSEASSSSTDPHDLHQGSSADDGSITVDHKEGRKLVRRIVKAIHQPLQTAIRQECDLSRKPYAVEVARMEALFKGVFDGAEHEPKSATFNEEDLANSSALHDGNGAEQKQDAVDQVLQQANGDRAGQYRVENPQEEAAPVDLNTTQHPAPTEAETPEDSVQANGTTQKDKTTPSAYPDHTTPSKAYKQMPNPLASGGVPWYLETFDPVGTEIHEERWTGSEVLRGLSEELSEIGEEELRGLGDGFVGAEDEDEEDDEEDDEEEGEERPDERGPTDVKRSPTKKRRRNRSYW